MPGFLPYLKQHRNQILLGVLGFVLGTVILGTVLALFQEGLKRFFFSDDTTATIRQVQSSTAAFPSQSLEVYQILAYDIAASDLLRNIKVTVVFPKSTEIILYHAAYSVNVDGFDAKQPANYHLELTLRHYLDVKRRVRLYLLTRREVASLEFVKSESPEISLDGTDKKGNAVHRSGID
jgi:hypothetical protein